MDANVSIAAVNEAECLAKTSSRCVPGSITGTHDFEVIMFSLLDGMGTGKFVSSKNFSVGGCDWSIWLYPDGKSTEHRDYVSVFLGFQGGKTEVSVKFILSLLDRDGQVKNLLDTTHTFNTVGAGMKGWGWFGFMKKSDLKPLLRLNNDSFTIRCVLTVIKEPQVEDVIESVIVVPQSNLLQDFAQMLKDGEGADVTFKVGDQLFPAHRCVLAARSLVFKAELFCPMKEKVADHVTIDDMEPSIFEALLHFIYTDSLPDDCDTDENVRMQHLLVAADRYGLERLMLMCEAKLCDGIDVPTVATTLAVAEQHNCAQLKDACLRYIASSVDTLGAVMETDGFKHLKASCPLIATEILSQIAVVNKRARLAK